MAEVHDAGIIILFAYTSIVMRFDAVFTRNYYLVCAYSPKYSKTINAFVN